MKIVLVIGKKGSFAHFARDAIITIGYSYTGEDSHAHMVCTFASIVYRIGIEILVYFGNRAISSHL